VRLLSRLLVVCLFIVQLGFARSVSVVVLVLTAEPEDKTLL